MSDDVLRARVLGMAETLRHRGPDDGGAWVDPRAGIALGHRRLSIIDLSPNGRQPMVSVSGRFVLSFNGEIYNHAELRRQLGDAGRRFRGRSDTEVLLVAVEEWGLRRALKRANGMFAFALWDGLEGRLHLARDRIGEKPLYYGRVGGVFAFASELKALRALPGFDAEIDREALGLFLLHSCVPAPRSIYDGISKLPPGSYLSVSASTVHDPPRPASYWSLREVAERGTADPFTGSSIEAAEALDELLRDAVRLRMVADVPLGAFLSGGIDSSTVVALMQAQSSAPVRTFTIGTFDAQFNEAVDAKAVAAHLGTDHTELYVTPAETMAVIPRLPALYDEPFADSSQMPTALVAELARRHVTVSLSGDGGDELFGGYNRHLWASALRARAAGVPAGLRRAAARVLTSLPEEQWDRLFRAVGPALPSRLRVRMPGNKVSKIAALLCADGPEAAYRSLAYHWPDAPQVVRGAAATTEPLGDGLAWPGAPDATRWMMYADAATYLPDDILTKLDRATMSVGLEGRVPLLDHRVVEFAWRVPLSMKIRDGRGKWLLRRVLHRYVAPWLVERPKMGFGLPIGVWLRGPLREWAESLLDGARLRREGLLNAAPIRRKWTEHLSGKRNWQYDLWDVLMFESWLEDGVAHPAPQNASHR